MSRPLRSICLLLLVTTGAQAGEEVRTVPCGRNDPPPVPRTRGFSSRSVRLALACCSRATSAVGWRCTNRLHKTHGTAIGGETTVVYGWHPWSGRSIRLHEVIERTAGASARCSLVDAFVVRVQEFPVWMLDATVCRSTHSATEPVAALGALTALAGLLREATRHTRADAVPSVEVASPESQGERRAATAPSSAPEAASTIGTALGGHACSASITMSGARQLQ